LLTAAQLGGVLDARARAGDASVRSVADACRAHEATATADAPDAGAPPPCDTKALTLACSGLVAGELDLLMRAAVI
jgi:hypothetical protein